MLSCNTTGKVMLCSMGDLDLHYDSCQHKLACGKLPLNQHPNVMTMSLSEACALTIRICIHMLLLSRKSHDEIYKLRFNFHLNAFQILFLFQSVIKKKSKSQMLQQSTSDSFYKALIWHALLPLFTEDGWFGRYQSRNCCGTTIFICSFPS